MDPEQIINKALSKVSRQSYWLGFILGILAGFALGFVVAYGQGDKTVVIPLAEGIRT